MKLSSLLAATTVVGRSLPPTTESPVGAIPAQSPLHETLVTSTATGRRLWHATNSYTEVNAQPATGTYEGTKLEGFLFTKPEDGEDFGDGLGDPLDGLFLVKNDWSDVMHFYFKPTIFGIPFGDNDGTTWAYGGFLRGLHRDGQPFTAFTKEQLEDTEFLKQHQNDTWHGTDWGTPYTGPCPSPYPPDSKCYEEMENPVTVTGPIQELMSLWTQGYPITLKPMTLEFDGAVAPVEVRMLHRNVERRCALTASRGEDGTLQLSKPRMVGTTIYSGTPDNRTGQTRVVADVYSYDLVRGRDGVPTENQQCPSSLGHGMSAEGTQE